MLQLFISFIFQYGYNESHIGLKALHINFNVVHFTCILKQAYTKYLVNIFYKFSEPLLTNNKYKTF